jgi:transposase
MFIQVNYVRQNGKTYRYPRIAESYRDKNGKPRNKIIANLGNISRRAEENLKIAFEAARNGKSVVIAPDLPGLSEKSKIKANLRYLDIALLLEMWRKWNLSALLNDIIHDGNAKMKSSDVISALVFQRCVAPRSKSHAVEWLRTTALPELLAINFKHFNNTRIHKVLNSLHACSRELQEALPKLYESQDGKFAMTFMDVTNTYFHGRGCEMAERIKTKEGIGNKLAIGIVLLANEKGYPLRWQVVPGRMKDHQAMEEMVKNVKELPWLEKTPLIMDRAMGRETTIQGLLDSGLYFLTAVPVNTIESYTMNLPWSIFSKIELSGRMENRTKDIQSVRQIVRADKRMTEVDEELFIIDLGKVYLNHQDMAVVQKRIDKHKEIKESLILAKTIQKNLDSKEYKNQKAAAQKLGLNLGKVTQILKLLYLSEDIQKMILESEPGFNLTYSNLKLVMKERDHHRQFELLSEILSKSNDNPDQKSDSKYLRLIAYFNPQMFVDQRNRAEEHCEELSKFIETLNSELANAKRTRTRETTKRKIMRELEKKNYVEVFEISLKPTEIKTTTGKIIQSFRCNLEKKQKQWERLRRFDGFVLLVAHPDIPNSGKEIALMYRAKDAIEKDFEKIKSFLKLRPIFHHTDPKVQAHVDICMLGLLLQRTLENELKRVKISLSPQACFEILSTCHLNLIKSISDSCDIYSVTESTHAQSEILDALGYSKFLDDHSIMKMITPRFVRT